MNCGRKSIFNKYKKLQKVNTVYEVIKIALDIQYMYCSGCDHRDCSRLTSSDIWSKTDNGDYSSLEGDWTELRQYP
jgi:hypothetical protein